MRFIRADINTSLGRLVLLGTMGLLLGLLLGLPFLHQFHHHELLEAPLCPVKLLQISLSLFFLCLLAFLFFRPTSAAGMISLELLCALLSFSGFTPATRAPPFL